jgi:hypothetical protein
MGLIRTRKQDHTVETIAVAVKQLRLQYPKAGLREMQSLLFHEENMSVSWSVALILIYNLTSLLTII